jgi:hypothetical protein
MNVESREQVTSVQDGWKSSGGVQAWRLLGQSSYTESARGVTIMYKWKASVVVATAAVLSALQVPAVSGDELPAAPSWNKEPSTGSGAAVKPAQPTPGYRQWLQQRLRDPLSAKDTEEEAYAKDVVFAGLFGRGGLVAVPDQAKRFQIVQPGARLGRIQVEDMGDAKLAFTLDGRAFKKLGPAKLLPICPDGLSEYLQQMGEQFDRVKPYTSGTLTIDVTADGYVADQQGNIFIERAVPFAPLPAGFKMIRAELLYGPERKTAVDLILLDLK